MPNYKLIYFDAKARAEVNRYMFALAGVEYEDKRVTEEWPKLKPTLPFGQMPVLEVDGKQLVQSRAISRYVATELGFYEGTSWNRAQIDIVLETCREMDPLLETFFENLSNQEKMAELRGKIETQFDKVLGKLEHLLKLNDGGDSWFVGEKVTLADVTCFSLFTDFHPVVMGKEADLSKYEKLAELTKRFRELPQIAEWLEKRPKTKL